VTLLRASLLAVFVMACAPAPTPTVAVSPSPSAEPSPISGDAAVSIARAQPSPKADPDDDVLDVRRGTFGELGSDYVAPGRRRPRSPVGACGSCRSATCQAR